MLGDDYDLGDPGKTMLEEAVAKTNPGFVASVTRLTKRKKDKAGEIHAVVRVVGAAPPMEACKEMAIRALNNAVAQLRVDDEDDNALVALQEQELVSDVEEVESARKKVVAEPQFDRVPPSRLGLFELVADELAVDAAQPVEEVAEHAQKVEPPESNLDGCRSRGTGTDPILNKFKNRTDTGDWHLVTLDSIVNLTVPPGVGSKDRPKWTDAQSASVAQFEGLPVQVIGWIALLAKGGAESCNCCAKLEVDFHLLLVDTEEKAKLKRKAGPLAVVCEVTPRVQRDRTWLSSERLSFLTKGAFPVRVSGWLMLDQEHDEGLGRHRATLWEIHPIMEIDVLVDGNWVSLKDWAGE